MCKYFGSDGGIHDDAGLLKKNFSMALGLFLGCNGRWEQFAKVSCCDGLGHILGFMWSGHSSIVPSRNRIGCERKLEIRAISM